MNRRRPFQVFVISVVLFALTVAARAGERFADINVTPQSLASGVTHHGYREFRVLLENLSTKTTHEVTLAFPQRAYGMGNSISRLSRTVSVGPLSRASVPIWQPPLPVNGNGQIQVVIDGEAVGTVILPSGAQHAAQAGGGYSGSGPGGTILVSRSLNFDDVSKTLKKEATGLAFGAAGSVGVPDGTSAGGLFGTCWMPDASRSGPHWIELDYEKPQLAERVLIYETMGRVSSGEAILIGVSGTNVARVRIESGASSSSGRGTVQVVPCKPTEPVKTVRLEFDSSTYAGSISIDAVGLSGPAGSTWAQTARASSESTVAAPVGSPSDSIELLRSEVPIAQWSEYWLSYTPYDGIVVNAADLKAAPAAVHDALWRYAECGGNLIVFGGGEAPAPWRSLLRSYLDGGERFNVGFGQCFLLETDRPPGLSGLTVKAISDAVGKSALFWLSIPDENTANNAFPVIENIRVPIRGMVFIMLGFVILIGPVNLIVLSRLKRRTWLLWTIPTISFVTCLLVFVYSMFSEGVTPDVRTDGLTLLDQVNRRAASVGMTAFYCPLTPSQGLFFGSETEATPLVSRGEFGSGSPRELDWSQSQHLRRGWITARVPSHFRLRKSESRRERLQVDYGAGQRTVMNGLGARILVLWLADSEGKLYSASGISAGQTLTLPASSQGLRSGGQSGLRSFLDSTRLLAEGPDPKTAPNYLLPNTYVAELEGNPFLENGLGPKGKSARTRARCVVYGILEAP